MDSGARRKAEPRLGGGSEDFEKEGDRKAWRERARGRRNLKMGCILPFSVGSTDLGPVIVGRGC